MTTPPDFGTQSEPVRLSAADVEDAAQRLAGLIRHTPLTRSERLSQATGAKVLLKREDLQPVRSYKNRGAINVISQLDPDVRERGVTCASAGNHAQGVAWACAMLEVPARIFLPRTTPRQKRQRVADIGGSHVDVVLIGGTYDEAAAACEADAQQYGRTKIPAFDHPGTVTGQGTVAREIAAVLGRAPDVLLVPVGGGGLLAGSLTYLRETAPQTRIIGVEPAGAASMAAAIDAGEPVTLADLDPFVDGAAVRRVGDVTYPIVAAGAPELISIDEGQICQEMLALHQTEGIVAEPAGALATAALTDPSLDLGIEPDQTVVAVVSGGNNDVLRYPEIVERALIHEGRKHYFLIDFPQQPGALRHFLDGVLGPDDDIAHFEYTKRNNRDTGPALVGIELGAPDDLGPLLDRMRESSIQVERIDPQSPLFRFIL